MELRFSKPEKLRNGELAIERLPDGRPEESSPTAIASSRHGVAIRKFSLASPGEKEVGLGEGVDVSIAAGYVAWSSARGIELLSIRREITNGDCAAWKIS